MLLFNSVVFGAFVGFLVDKWLERATVRDPIRLILAIVAFVVSACLIYFANWTVF